MPRLCVALSSVLISLVAKSSAHAQAFDFDAYVRSNLPTSTPSNEDERRRAEFLAKFPFKQNLKTVAFTDIATIQRHRLSLWKVIRDGDFFVYALGDYFIANYPVASLDDAEQKTAIAEVFLARRQNLRPAVDEIYHHVGMFLLGRVAKFVEVEIRERRIDSQDSRVTTLVDRLKLNKVIVPIEDASLTKVVTSIKQGRFTYLITRLVQAINRRRALILMVSVFLVVVAIGFKVWERYSSGGWRGKVAGVSVTLAVLSLACLGLGAWQNRAGAQKTGAGTRLSLAAPRLFHPAGGTHALQVFPIRLGHIEVGHAIWLRRPNVRATYLAAGQVGRRYAEMTTRSRTLLAAAGGFTNRQGLPEGLTIDEGTVVNAMIMYDRHGIGMFTKSGINVLSLKRAEIALPGSATIRNPLESLRAYADLLRWARKTKATFFQTQLLAFSDKLEISETRASPELRERRLLALVSDKSTSEIHHVVFNLVEPFPLAVAARDAVELLGARNKKIEALMNLDVGSYDILEVFDDSGAPLPEIRGRFTAAKATNLLVYTL